MKEKSHFKDNLLEIPPKGVELNFTYHYYLGGRIATEVEPSVFERDDFIKDPIAVKSVVPFYKDDIVSPLQLWDKIRNGNDPLSQYLRRQFSASMRRELSLCQDEDSSSLLKTMLSNKLNQFLISNRFRSEKDYQTSATPVPLDQQQWIDLVSLNRTLLAQTYEGCLSEKHEIEARYRIHCCSLRSAQATAYFSDRFLSEIILTQFQISIENETAASDTFRIHLHEGGTRLADCPFCAF
ncbi:MAG: hypothetical protein ACE5F7_07480 [Nitrospiria bacterium]